MASPVIAERVVHHYRQRIDGPPSVVFPLLCPEREKEWIPGWEARMIHSQSGFAEPGAVFATPHADGEALWVVVEHAPDRLVRFVRVEPDGVLVDIRAEVTADGEQRSCVDIRYAFIATRAEAVAAVRRRTTDAWEEMMVGWQRLMNAYLHEQWREAPAC